MSIAKFAADKVRSIWENFKVKTMFPHALPIDNSNRWHQYMFGTSPDHRLTRDDKIKIAVNGDVTFNSAFGILSVRNNLRNYYAGWSSLYSIQTISDEVAKIPLTKDAATMIIEFVDMDVGRQHYAAAEGDIFQVSSSFNSLDFNSNQDRADGIGDYSLHNSQNVQCSLACAAGTYIRNWYMGTSFNCLGNLQKPHPVPFNKSELIWGDHPEPVYKAITAEYNQIHIPVQMYTQVCGPIIDGSEAIFPAPPANIIHQIYCPSVAYNTKDNRGDVGYQNAIVGSIQQAGYYATLGLGLILGTVDSQRQYPKRPRITINLTLLIGPDTYNNSVESCINIMVTTLQMFVDYPLRIVINSKHKNAIIKAWTGNPHILKV
jgi:hypothetical protein